jgi:hypothetical protein
MSKQIFDITVRDVLKDPILKLIERLVGKKIVRSLDISLPSIKERKVDILLEAEDRSLIHIELQSTNHKYMHYRMLEYRLEITRKFKTNNIIQFVIYLGEKKCTMKSEISEKDLIYRYNLIDIKQIPCQDIIKEDDIDSIVLGFLCNLKNKEKLLEKLKIKLSTLDDVKRADWIRGILLILGLRPKLKKEFQRLIDREEIKMPITIRIRRDLIEDLPVIGDLLREAEREAMEKGVEKGLKEGLKEGLQKGLQEGLVKAKQEDIIKVLEAKFGKLSKTINSKIKKINDLNKLEALLLEAVKSESLEEFKTKL